MGIDEARHRALSQAAKPAKAQNRSENGQPVRELDPGDDADRFRRRECVGAEVAHNKVAPQATIATEASPRSASDASRTELAACSSPRPGEPPVTGRALRDF